MFKKRTIFFLFVVIALFSLMTYQSRKGYSVPDSPLAFIVHGISSAIATAADTVRRPFEAIALRDEENHALKAQIDALLLDRMNYQEVMSENKRLRELLKLRETQKDVIATARVIGRGTSHWSHTLIIDKGLRDGITKDTIAITPKGLAGKIYNVSSSYASLLLITDINFSAAVRLQEGRKEGVLSGTGNGNTLLKYIPPEEEVKTGDVVVTSGLDQLFPAGIPAGYVSAVDKQGTGQFQRIEVAPFVDTRRIEEVLVLK